MTTRVTDRQFRTISSSSSSINATFMIKERALASSGKVNALLPQPRALSRLDLRGRQAHPYV
eukprot:6214494-Pleurochrysis_carterae.AAC.1